MYHLESVLYPARDTVCGKHATKEFKEHECHNSLCSIKWPQVHWLYSVYAVNEVDNNRLCNQLLNALLECLVMRVVKNVIVSILS